MMPVYRGVKHQYGYGLGSLFKSALRTVTPLLKPLVKSGLNALKKEGIKQGIGAAQDIFLHGKNPKAVLISRGKESVKDLAQNLIGGINKPKTRQSRHLKSRTHRGKIVSKRHKKHYSKPRTLDVFD